MGTATTNASGVTTLTGVANTAAVGTDSGAVGVSFANVTDYTASSGTGDLTVSQAATAPTAVSGAATSGGTATLTATLTSSETNQGLAGQTVSFTLDGALVGTAATDASGVATLTSVPTSDPVGTRTGAVVASYAGATDFLAGTGTGDLVVTAA